MNCVLPASLISLPNEVVDQILPLLAKPTLLSIRLVNRRLGTHATRLLFRSVRLGARQKIGQDSGLFCFAARSEDAALTRDPSDLGPLRDLVREVTLDTWLGSSFKYFTCDDWEPNLPVHPGDFMNALPNLRRFSNLSAVHLRFNEVCGDDRGSGYVEEGLDFRYRVLDTTFRCLAGTWNVSDQQDIDREINLKYSTDYSMSQVVPEPPSTGPLPIKTLTVSNLADIPDERLTSSKAFQTVLSLPSLVDLKLYFTIQGDHEWVGDYPIWVSEKYKFFDSLPQTWLRPSIATNLRTLSLYSASPWGWNPKMDFRFVNPTENGFPNLKVLALGNYVFSHAWQIDWFASQGSKTVAGGLEELYLDKCRVMFHATHLTPLDQSTAIVGKDPEGKDIKVSNAGYQKLDLILESATRYNNWDNSPYGPTAETDFPLRWHDILSRWQESMTALRVFKMGIGSWRKAPQVVIDIHHQDTPKAREHMGEWRPYRNVEDNVFRSFDLPSGSTAINKGATNFPGMEKYRHGVGINEGQHQLEYAFCTMDYLSDEWVELDRPTVLTFEEFRVIGEKVDKETRAKDKVALELFVSTVNNRGKGVE